MERNWQHAAGVLWPVLTGRAERREPVTYTELAPLIDTNPLSVRLTLSPIQDYCLDMRLPPLTVIVIGKNTRIPGTGFVAWDVDDLMAGQELVYRKDWSSEPNPYGSFGVEDTEETFAEQILDSPDQSRDVYARIRVRGVAQRIFRATLLKAYNYECAFCGLTFGDTLDAAHIKDWEDSDHAERLHPSNGVLLCASHHRLFDAGKITITSRLKVFFYDNEEEDGPYSEADRASSISLNGNKLSLPRDKRHWPSIEFLLHCHKKQKLEKVPR
jgi:putative restriction endonuclease